MPFHRLGSHATFDIEFVMCKVIFVHTTCICSAPSRAFIGLKDISSSPVRGWRYVLPTRWTTDTAHAQAHMTHLSQFSLVPLHCHIQRCPATANNLVRVTVLLRHTREFEGRASVRQHFRNDPFCNASVAILPNCSLDCGTLPAFLKSPHVLPLWSFFLEIDLQCGSFSVNRCGV